MLGVLRLSIFFFGVFDATHPKTYNLLYVIYGENSENCSLTQKTRMRFTRLRDRISYIRMEACYLQRYFIFMFGA